MGLLVPTEHVLRSRARAPSECGAVYAAFKGHDSPLRHHETLASCAYGGHRVWWRVKAASEEEALVLLPFYVAERATAARVGKWEIP
jgi:hypothetical protein